MAAVGLAMGLESEVVDARVALTETESRSESIRGGRLSVPAACAEGPSAGNIVDFGRLLVRVVLGIRLFMVWGRLSGCYSSFNVHRVSSVA